MFPFFFKKKPHSYSYDSSSRYLAGGASLDTSKIRSIEIGWLAGDVTVESWDSPLLSFTEPDGLPLADRLRYRLENGKLSIRFSPPLGLDAPGGAEKALLIRLPQAKRLERLSVSNIRGGCVARRIRARQVSLSSVSETVRAEGFFCQSLHMQTVSGGAVAEKVKALSLSGETVSGAARFTGEFRKINFQGVSGGVTISSAATPDNMDVSTVDGDISVFLPDNRGLSVHFETVSGQYQSCFQSLLNTEQAAYQFGSISGNVVIEKLSRAGLAAAAAR